MAREIKTHEDFVEAFREVAERFDQSPKFYQKQDYFKLLELICHSVNYLEKEIKNIQPGSSLVVLTTKEDYEAFLAQPDRDCDNTVVSACLIDELLEKRPEPEYKNVEFDMGGHGEQIASQTILKGSLATEPEAPTAQGYIFKGWYSDPEFEAEYLFDTPVNEDIILYAKWVANVYTVKFNMNGHGAPVPAEQQVSYEEKVIRPADPAAEGYEFGGWYKNAACTIPYNFDVPVTSSLTLYAKWTKIVQKFYVYLKNGINSEGFTPAEINANISATGYPKPSDELVEVEVTEGDQLHAIFTSMFEEEQPIGVYLSNRSITDINLWDSGSGSYVDTDKVVFEEDPDNTIIRRDEEYTLFKFYDDQLGALALEFTIE